MKINLSLDNKRIQIPLLFLVARFILFLSLPISGIRSYGDFWNFYNIAELGTPFVDNWVEFPPLFPFIARLIYLVVGGRQHAFDYSLALILSILQATGIFVFGLIAERIFTEKETSDLQVQYAFFLVGLLYSWAYFDPLAVLFLLIGVYLILMRKDISAGFMLGLGGLVKLFPVLALASAWKFRSGKQAARTILTVIAVVALVYGFLFLAAPGNTRASIISQGSKGSWETVWAMLDGNWGTGNFNPDTNRLDPTTASLPTGNPARISPWLTLLIFAGIGFFLFLKAEIDTERKMIAFNGLTLCIFFLWSPGYSPQWILFLLPFTLLCLNKWRGTLLSITMILVHLTEWPVILSRGGFDYLGGIIVVRTLLMVILAGSFLEIVFKKNKELEYSN